MPPKRLPLLGGPLKPQHLLVLVALARGPIHGYEVRKELERNGLSLDPGSLYRVIARLVDEGLIASAAIPDKAAPDPRRRYYELTPLGKRTLLAETDRLAEFVDAVRAIRALNPPSRA